MCSTEHISVTFSKLLISVTLQTTLPNSRLIHVYLNLIPYRCSLTQTFLLLYIKAIKNLPKSDSYHNEQSFHNDKTVVSVCSVSSCMLQFHTGHGVWTSSTDSTTAGCGKIPRTMVPGMGIFCDKVSSICLRKNYYFTDIRRSMNALSRCAKWRFIRVWTKCKVGGTQGVTLHLGATSYIRASINVGKKIKSITDIYIDLGLCSNIYYSSAIPYTV